MNFHPAALNTEADTQVLKNVQHMFDVEYVGDIVENYRLISEQRRGNHRQNRIFITADFNFTTDGSAPMNNQFAHNWISSISNQTTTLDNILRVNTNTGFWQKSGPNVIKAERLVILSETGNERGMVT